MEKGWGEVRRKSYIIMNSSLKTKRGFYFSKKPNKLQKMEFYQKM
jgi:hypothetical protein